MEKKNRLRNSIIFMAVLVLLVGATTGCRPDNKTKINNGDQNESTYEHTEKTFTGIINKIDLDNKMIDFVDCMTGIEYSLIYNAGVEITNAYGKNVDVNNLKCGEILEVTYYTDTNKIYTMSNCDKVSKRENVSKFTISPDNRKVSYKGVECNVAEHFRAYDNNANIDVKEISTEDLLTLYFYGDKLMSANVEVGHGYVSLHNHETYIDGMVEIGKDVIVPVTKDMLLEVREGVYTLRISKNGYSDEKSDITVIKGGKTDVNIADIAIPRGTVVFDITPGDATLYVSGLKQNEHAYSNTYGVYSVRIEAEGYNTFRGKFEIKDTVKTFEISLQKTDANEETTETTEEPSTTESNTTEFLPTNNTVTIATPVEVGVYIDGDYVGMAPVTIPKTVGTHTVTLYKSGYLIKSYTIQSLDDGKNDTYSLADLIPIDGPAEVISD